MRRFGSLRRALQESGMTPARFMKATDEELFSIFIELWTQTLEKSGRSPYRRELRTFAFPVSSDTYVRRFGSWKKALLAAARSVSSADDLVDAPTLPQTQTSKFESRKALSIRKRFFVLKRDRYRCRMCGRSGVELEVDHKIPIAQGGSNALDNLQTLCFDCNRGKRHSSE
ncbi:MAG: HNH endonuclease [Terriglobales bacterium]